MIYFIEARWLNELIAIKIGVTDNVRKRFHQIRASCPCEVSILGVMSGNNAGESKLHRTFAASQITGEWFRPITELLEYIETYAHPVDVPELRERRAIKNTNVLYAGIPFPEVK